MCTPNNAPAIASELAMFLLLAVRTKNFSGAEIEGLVKAAVSFALNRQVDVSDLSKPIDEENIKVIDAPVGGCLFASAPEMHGWPDALQARSQASYPCFLHGTGRRLIKIRGRRAREQARQ